MTQALPGHSRVSVTYKNMSVWNKGKTKVDLTGRRFGHLAVLGPARCPRNRLLCECLCECGEKTQVRPHRLINGTTRSCGCSRNEDKELIEDEASARWFYRSYKVSARQAKREFALTLEQFRKITSLPCHYCGAAPAPRSRPDKKSKLSQKFISSGVDRVDNAVGYVPENCVPCCYTCNIMKRSHSVSAFLAHVKRIVDWSAV